MTDISGLRAGVVGTGFVGVVHVQALRLLGIEVAGIVGSSPERAAAKGIAPVYASLEELLADDSVDVVHLTTPNHLHHPQVKHVLAAGKNVVCEKPLAMTSTESAELLRLAEASGAVAVLKGAATVVAVHRADGEIELEPPPYTTVAPGDVVVAVGSDAAMDALEAKFAVDGVRR